MYVFICDKFAQKTNLYVVIKEQTVFGDNIFRQFSNLFCLGYIIKFSPAKRIFKTIFVSIQSKFALLKNILSKRMAEPSSYLQLIKTLFKSKYCQPLYNKDKRIVTKSSQIINEADPTKINFDNKIRSTLQKHLFLHFLILQKKSMEKENINWRIKRFKQFIQLFTQTFWIFTRN